MSNGGDNRQLTVELENEKLRKRVAKQANAWRLDYNKLAQERDSLLAVLGNIEMNTRSIPPTIWQMEFIIITVHRIAATMIQMQKDPGDEPGPW